MPTIALDVLGSPNLEMVRYTRDPDPVNLPGRRLDAQLRLTFFWTF